MAARMVLATASKPIVTNKYIARGKFRTDFLTANNQLKMASLSHKLLSSLKICHFFIFSRIFFSSPRYSDCTLAKNPSCKLNAIYARQPSYFHIISIEKSF